MNELDNLAQSIYRFAATLAPTGPDATLARIAAEQIVYLSGLWPMLDENERNAARIVAIAIARPHCP